MWIQLASIVVVVYQVYHHINPTMIFIWIQPEKPMVSQVLFIQLLGFLNPTSSAISDVKFDQGTMDVGCS
jgi:hypothetical protein